MQLDEAIQLIKNAKILGGQQQAWADLGCGSGLFTNALLSILPAGSTVHAVDKMNTITGNNPSIIFQQADFEKEDLPFSNLHGILLANSLHYIADQLACILKLNTYLNRQNARYILVEYDSETANQWVPHPLPFLKAKQLFARAGFPRIEKIGEKKSLYRQGNIYACCISQR